MTRDRPAEPPVYHEQELERFKVPKPETPGRNV